MRRTGRHPDIDRIEPIGRGRRYLQMSRDSLIGPNSIDEEDVRLTAYFLWEQEGHPEGRAKEFWYRAWAMHRRAHVNGTELQAGLAPEDGLPQ